MQWYYAKEGAQFGPIDDTELRRLARSGEITPDDLVWNTSMGDQWKPASSFSFLFFAPVDLQPPTIPKGSESGSSSDGITPNRYLVSRARASLNGYWGMAVLAMIIYLAVFIVFGVLNGLISASAQVPAIQTAHQTIATSAPPKIILPLGIRIASYGLQLLQQLLAAPFAVGLCIFFLKIAHRSGAKATDIFKGFSLFWKAVGAYFLVMFLMLFWALLFMLPAIAFLIWKKIDLFHGQHPDFPIFVLLCIAGSILLMVKMISYAMTYFVIADDPTIGPIQAIKKSTVMMTGKKWKFICLQLRFIGWWFLSLLTCGIGFLWLVPYIQTATAHFYLDVKDRAALPES